MMKSMEQILPEIERLERSSRRVAPLGIVGLLAVLFALVIAGMGLKKLRVEVAEAESRKVQLTQEIAELENRLKAAQTSVATAREAVGSLKEDIKTLTESTQTSPEHQQVLAQASDKTDQLDSALIQTSEELASTPAIVPRIYFHISRAEQRDDANRVAKELRRTTGFVVPGIEHRQGPNTTQLRYFRQSEKETAESIQETLRTLGVESKLTYVGGSEDSTKVRPLHFELWYGAGAAG